MIFALRERFCLKVNIKKYLFTSNYCNVTLLGGIAQLNTNNITTKVNIYLYLDGIYIDFLM